MLHIVVLNAETLAVNMAKSMEVDIQILIANDWPDYRKLVRAHYGSIGIIEFDLNLDAEKLLAKISTIQSIVQNNPNSRFLAVGKPDLAKIGRELLISGFANVFCSYADVGRMAAAAVRHHRSVIWPDQTVEQAVAKNLPWAPVRATKKQLPLSTESKRI